LGFTGWPYNNKMIIRSAQLAEKSEFDVVWVAEDYYTGRDAVTLLACLALSTKKVNLGTGVIGAYSRSPVLTGATLSTLDEISDGRMILGLGAGLTWPSWTEAKETKSIKKMRETVELLRLLLSGANSSFEGSPVTLTQDVPWWPFERIKQVRSGIPIYLGGYGPRMIQLAAEVGDGLIVEWFTPLHVVKERISRLRAHAEHVGKDYAKIDVTGMVVTSPSRDGKIGAPLRWIVGSRILRLNEDLAEQVGIQKKKYEKIKKEFQRGNMAEVSKCVSDDLVRHYTASGTAEECVNKLKEYEKAGLKLPMVFPLGCDLELAIEVGRRFKNV